MRNQPNINPASFARNIQRWLTVLLTVLLVGCPHPSVMPTTTAPTTDTGAAANSPYALRGRVDFGDRTTQTDTTEIANASTVSLIDATTGVTLGTSVTTTSGAFLLTFGNSFRPTANTAYYVEAVKGLKVGGLPNRAGASVARIRTIAYFDYTPGISTWVSITNKDASSQLVVGRSSTTLAIIDNLRGFSSNPVNRRALIGSVVVGSPDQFTPGTTGVAASEYNTVFSLVTSALTLNQDPVFVITYDVNSGVYNKIVTSVTLSGLLPGYGRIGDTVTIVGSNFSSDPTQNSVRFNGTPAASLSADPSGTHLYVQVPVGATTGAVQVQVSGTVFGGFSYQVLSWDGHTPFDTNNNLYVSGSAVNMIFQVAPNGTITKWLSGNGLNQPAGITVDATNSVYVANLGANNILKVTSSGAVSVYATGGGLNQPEGLAFDRWGNLYIANRGSNQILRVAPGGGTPTLYSADASLNQPVSLAFDQSSNLWVANYNGNTISKIATGSLSASTPVVGLNHPGGVAFDATNTLYIANYSENQIVRYNLTGAQAPIVINPSIHLGIRSLAFNTNGLMYAGAYDSHTIFTRDQTGALHDLCSAPRSAWGIARDTVGNLYIGINNFTKAFTRPVDNNVYMVPWNATTNSYDPFVPLSSGYRSPNALCFDASGRFYVGDNLTNRVYQVNAGTGAKSLYTSGFSGGPMGLGFDSTNKLLVATRWGGGPQTVTTSGAWTTYAQGRRPTGVVGDGAGNLYVSSQDCGTITKIHSDGLTCDVYASGLNFPYGLTWFNGQLYVAEINANRVSVINASGVRSDFCTGLSNPVGVAFDASGNAYVACRGDNTIRKIPAGTSTAQAFATGLINPRGIVYYNNNLYVTNEGNVNNSPAVVQVPISSPTPVIYATMNTGQAILWGLGVDTTTGNLYVSAGTQYQGGGGVYKIPSGGGSFSQFAAAASWPTGVWVDSVNQKLYLGICRNKPYPLNGRLLTSWPLSNGSSPSYLGTSMPSALSIAHDSTNRLIAGCARLGQFVVRWNPDGTGYYRIGDTSGPPIQLYVDGSDNIYAALGSNNRIRKFTKVTDTSFTTTDFTANVGWASGVIGDGSGNLYLTSMTGGIGNAPLMTIPNGQTAAQLIPHWFYQPEF